MVVRVLALSRAPASFCASILSNTSPEGLVDLREGRGDVQYNRIMFLPNIYIKMANRVQEQGEREREKELSFHVHNI